VLFNVGCAGIAHGWMNALSPATQTKGLLHGLLALMPTPGAVY